MNDSHACCFTLHLGESEVNLTPNPSPTKKQLKMSPFVLTTPLYSGIEFKPT